MENILSVRVVGVGGGVADHVEDTPKGWVAGRRRVIVLVHGYNNTEKDAKESYRDFTQHLQGYAQLLDLGQFFWPGDANLGFLSAVSYPFEIKDAKESAARLAEFLAAAQGPQGPLGGAFLGLADEVRDQLGRVLQVGAHQHHRRPGRLEESVIAGLDGAEIIGVEDYLEIRVLRGEPRDDAALQYG